MTDLSFHDKAILNCIFNPNLPLADCYEEELNEKIEDDDEKMPGFQEIKSMELEAVRKAENEEFDQALQILEKAIFLMPNRASLYNNRAQVYQLKGLIKDASEDLAKAIELSKNNQNKTLCQALCQRGLMYRKNNETDLAKSDFEKAAQLGSKFAKSQLVELNPYAALCNQMLRKVMDDLK